MTLPIYTYNHPVLRQKVSPVSEMTDELSALIDAMFETMYYSNGIGLAANQVGMGPALTVIDVSDADEDEKFAGPTVLINPVIAAFSDEEDEFEEGCLSLPEFRDIVVRPEAIQVNFLDRNLKPSVLEANGLMARVIQHEVDHLNGIYFFERLSTIRRTLAQGKLKKIAKGEFSVDYETITP